MPLEPESDLHWKAFLYVAGELPGDEAADFERLLLDDQSAREAVASAVELVQVVGVLGPEAGSLILPKRQSRRGRALAWGVSVAAAAALLAAVLVPKLRSPVKTELDPSEVALAWSGLREGIDADWKALVADPHPAESTDPALATDPEALSETSTERPLPSWLLSAAATHRDDSIQEEN